MATLLCVECVSATPGHYNDRINLLLLQLAENKVLSAIYLEVCGLLGCACHCFDQLIDHCGDPFAVVGTIGT